MYSVVSASSATPTGSTMSRGVRRGSWLVLKCVTATQEARFNLVNETPQTLNR